MDNVFNTNNTTNLKLVL